MHKTITKPWRALKLSKKRLATFLMLAFFTLSLSSALAQKQVENLGRGLVAVRTSSTQVYVGWRLLGKDPSGIGFNLYRDGVKLNGTPITSSTNYVDNVSTNGTYTVKPVINGVEQPVSAPAGVWAQQYLTIPLQVPAGGTSPDGVSYTYSPNDCSPADLDGDGEYELVLKWDPSNSKDNSQSGYTGNVFIDAYKLNGTRMWRIDLGKNIRAGAHYTQLMVYDLDGDGKAEVACKTADGTKDGTGVVIGSSSADYRNSNGYILSGPEFLTIFNGETGKAMATTDFVPARGTVSSWGDSYGNRVDRFISTIAYLDGSRPSLIMGRGYYTRLVRVAWDWRNGTLTRRWTFDSNSSTPGNSNYYGQGNHQLTVGDVDGDGRDEICNGSSIINDDGTGLYANGLGHGDALHMSDMNPDRAGQEVWQCHEDPGSYGNYGLEFRDARTGSPLWGVQATGDVGRAMAADIDPNYKGYEVWGSAGSGVYSCTGTLISTNRPSYNFGLWWDGDLQREILDGTKLDKWNPSTKSVYRLFTFYNYGGADDINGSKANPCVSADLLGDWREEVVYKSNDNTQLVLFTTVTPATNRIYTLMHDPQYRCQVAQQNSAYNQPPHPSFYLGGGMSSPPSPNIQYAGANISGTFTMTARHSGQLVDVSGASLANGGDVIQWPATGGNNQKWKIETTGGIYYSIINVNSGKALDVYGASTANGADIIQYDYKAGTNQQWKINSLGNGYYSIINRKSGLSVDVAGASTAQGANVLQYTYSGAYNQQYALNATTANSGFAGPQPALALNLPAAETAETTIYPNPSASTFTLTIPGSFEYVIADELGRTCEKGKAENSKQVGAKLTAGVYFLKVTGQGKTRSYKIIKQ